MGSVCCVAVKDRKVPPSSGGHAGAALHRNSACSPQWSFRRDNRRRVADEIEGSPYYSPYVGSRGISMDKMSLGSLSEGGTPPDGHLGTPASQKSVTPEIGTNSMVPPSSDSSLVSHDPIEVKNLVESQSSIVPSALPKPVFSMPSLSPPVCDLSSAHSRLLPPKSTPSRRARRSPGHQLFRQVSDSQILGLKSPNNNYSVSEGRSSFVLSTCSNDFANGSNYASSEGGWSLNAFSELVAYSQRERWSFDSEQLDSGRRKLSGGSSRFSFSPSVVVDQQSCGACSKLLTERSSIATFELPIAAVLACGHVYHAECLETMTNEMEKYDPACPICTIGEKRVAKITRKALKAEAEAKAKHYKRCKNRVVDSYGESECDEFVFQKTGKREGKALKMEPSCSSKGPSKSFLKWHFASISSKWSKPSSKDSALKKGFWSRHRNSNRSSSSSIEGLNQTSQL
ncbi:unnamed protein product [Microthlaspi erraticum]|uniref:RING-type domain-containing protein n=1 Tax=Microthlaspi erraticum TaxID=1685480 RepID=A0A6D2JNU2_9BRAS|nr:unnamed protein product [Microthlaspi erraticum]